MKRKKGGAKGCFGWKGVRMQDWFSYSTDNISDDNFHPTRYI
ncbi:MAG: hypothetical protein ACO1NU_15320 [Arcticibacter sp.]